MWSNLLWLVGIAICVIACALVAPLTTPIDHLLAMAATVVMLAAWMIRDTRWWPAVAAAAPLLVACAVAFPQEQPRLLAYGIAVSFAFGGAMLAVERWTLPLSVSFVTLGVALLRWVGRERFELTREVLILAGAWTIAAVMEHGPLAIATALLVTLLTPGIPARTVVMPFLLAAALWLMRRARFRMASGHWQLVDLTPIAEVRPVVRPHPRVLSVVSVFVVTAVLLLFPWSGIVARDPLYLFRFVPRERRIPIGNALTAGQRLDFDVPAGMTTLVVSVANGLDLPRGTVVGTIDGRPIRIGEVADWGSGRREVWWRAAVSGADDPAGIPRGYGYDSWVDGAGRITIAGRSHIRVAADKALTRNACLQVEGFEE